MSIHHEGPVCSGCEAKLAQAHPYLAGWFRGSVKTKYPDAHVSCSFRGEEDQNKAFDDGASKLRFPQSAHNHTENGKPCSYALDLFQIINGQACFNPGFYAGVNSENDKTALPVFWGGRWKDLGDKDHFQYRPVQEKKS